MVPQAPSSSADTKIKYFILAPYVLAFQA